METDYINKNSREAELARTIESAVNDYGFNYKTFAQCIRYMHPTLQQNFFRLMVESIKFVADPSTHHVDARNKDSHELAKKLLPIVNEHHLSYV